MSTSGKANIRRKNLNVDQTKLDRARDLLKAPSETATVDEALSIVLFRQELMDGVRNVAGTGGVENVFEDDGEP